MNSSFVRWPFFCLAGALSVVPLRAADRAAEAPVAREPITARDVFAEGRALQEEGDEKQAESLLAALNPELPDTGAWHLQQGGLFLRLAFEFRENGKMAASLKAAARARDHLDKAAGKLAGSPEALANVYELQGVIAERLLGTSAEAEALYQAAVQTGAASRSATEKWDRLQQRKRTFEKQSTESKAQRN